MDICLGKPTEAYVDWCVKRVKLLLYHKVTPLMVFDGDRLPEKQKTEAERRASKDLNRAKGNIFLRGGEDTAAAKCFQRLWILLPRWRTN